MIRILLADDHAIIRVGLRAIIDGEADLTVVGEAVSPDDAAEQAAALRPDVVLMDLQFGTTLTGADATRRILALPDPPAVLVLTNYDTDSHILGAVEAGASGYLLKDAPPGELLAAVRAAAAGEAALAPAIATRLLQHMRSPAPVLSARELEVLALVAEGRSNSAIAGALFISEATVKSHLVHVFTKLGVDSRTGAVAEARRVGLLRG